MSNEMTLICMEASIIVKADVPLLTLRVHPNLNEKVWETALMLVKSGQGFPAFYNDEAVITARMNAGVSREDAYDYSTLGCVETTIAGREYSHTEGARINMLKLLELMLFQGECTLTGQNWNLKENHNLAEFATFEQFYAWYKIELEALVCKVAKFIDESSILYSEYWPSPYLSSITWGCMENGSDITDNGTKYYNLSINCAGMANTVDSLEAIEQAVFKERSVTFEQLKDAIKNNFLGYEELREKLLKYPKYGNDIDSVDNKMSDLMEFFTETVYKQKMIGNRGKFQCGFYTVMHHALMGIKTGASCDGRYAQTSLANSLSPSQGMDVNGPTAVINSINKISMKYMGNGGGA
jgi:formate C-acetyltransferase